MTAFNVVRVRVKPGCEDEFIEAHRRMRTEVITHACDGVVQALTVLRMVPKGLAPVRRAVSTTVRTAASPSAAHIAR
jgi:hypothetical protein